MARKKGSTIYYSDVYNDDFSKIIEGHPKLKENYKYKRDNKFYNFFSWILYWIIAKFFLPLIFFPVHFVTIKNRKKLKTLKKSGAFIYGNHTHWYDAFQIQCKIRRKRVNIVGYSDVTTYPIANKLVRSLGYIPLPDTMEQIKSFNDALDFYINKKKQHVLIYPEAHIWPYYTHIRPFKSASFHYPAKLNAPVVPIVTIWRKSKLGNMKETLIICDPIFPKKELSVKENKEYLASECYKEMVEVSNSYKQDEYYHYVYKSKDDKNSL